MKSIMLSRIFLFIAIVAVVGTGCKKLKNTTSGTDVTITPQYGDPDKEAGKGGEATLNISPNHDGLFIDSCKVYLKYNASVIPKDGKYDDSLWALQVDGSPVASFKNLKEGNYYIFAVGWDIIRSQKVKGGLPHTIIAEKKSTDQHITLAIQDYE